MRKKRFIGMLAVVWGVFFLLPMLFGGMHRHARSHAEFAHSRFEAAQQAQADGTDSAESTTPNTSHRSHRHGHHGHGPIGGLFHLLFLGFVFMALMKLFKRGRRRWHHHHHARQNGEKSPDDLTDDIRVGDEINRAEASGEASSEGFPSSEEMTVDDLVRAMKRLGIKKLEL